VDHVVDKLDTFLKGRDRDGVLVIFLSPTSVLSLALCGSGFNRLDGLIVVLVGLVEVNACLLEDLFVIGNRLGKGLNRLLVFADLVDKSGDGLVTGGLVGSVFLISCGLVVADLIQNFVNKEGDLLERGLNCHVQGNCGQHS